MHLNFNNDKCLNQKMIEYKQMYFEKNSILVYMLYTILTTPHPPKHSF